MENESNNLDLLTMQKSMALEKLNSKIANNYKLNYFLKKENLSSLISLSMDKSLPNEYRIIFNEVIDVANCERMDNNEDFKKILNNVKSGNFSDTFIAYSILYHYVWNEENKKKIKNEYMEKQTKLK